MTSAATRPERSAQLRRRLESLIGIPATEGNQITILRNGDEIFPAMLKAIRSAEHTVDFMTYVYWSGDIAHEFADALSERARNGVRVRVLIDAVGGFKIEDGIVDRMGAAGVSVEWFRKPWLKSPFKQNHRCHRKVLVVDETVGFTGGVGIAQEWCGDARNEDEWRDTHVRVEGPAVDGLAAGFSQNWSEGEQAMFDDRDRFPVHSRPGTSVVQVVRGSASIGWDDMQSLFHIALSSATERIRLVTAYFAPSVDFRKLLVEAVERGVQVDVLLPGPGADKRVCQLSSEATYAELIDADVNVWNFQPSMLHAKILTVDHVLSVIGSSNFNRRSMDHDEEIVMAILDPDVTSILDDQYQQDLDRSVAIDLERWRNRGPRQRALEAASQPIKRWL
ncbi:MAG TPA: phospholipase D-like domain-containing protein [Actinomycetes bacterium]|nr:phospholipase D-like domain-containing protein [Actinomycetes bacterium]